MKVSRYVNRIKIQGALPPLEINNPTVKEILRQVKGEKPHSVEQWSKKC